MTKRRVKGQVSKSFSPQGWKELSSPQGRRGLSLLGEQVRECLTTKYKG
jgi:hypothetical protein